MLGSKGPYGGLSRHTCRFFPLQDLERLVTDGGNLTRRQSEVALLFDYEALWYMQIQPQGVSRRWGVWGFFSPNLSKRA